MNLSKLLSIIFSFSLLCSLSISSCAEEEPTPEEPGEPSGPSTPINPYAGEIRDITSAELVAEMGIGWNLGNSFDVTDSDKTVWGNPLPNKAQLDAVKAMGFKTVRIPVTWNYNMMNIAPYTVDFTYMQGVVNMVNGALANDMQVIINIHHDNSWVKPTYGDANQVKARLAALWTQIANKFIDYGDNVIFETLNEPRLEGSPEEWSGGTAEGRDVLNQYHKACVDAIRATGGNNAYRHLMVSTYAASTVQSAMDDLIVPNDDPNIIISLHSYFPWSFCGQEGGTTTWGSDQEVAALEAEFDRIQQKWMVQEGRAVILGEFGAINRGNDAQRINYVDHYVRGAMSRGMLPIVWDDGGDFQLLDRNNNSWAFPAIAEKIVEAAQ